MADALGLALKLAPAFAYVGLGYAVKRLWRLDQKSAANFLFYFLIPVVVFRGAAFSDLARFASIAVISFGFGVLCAAATFLVPLPHRVPLRRSMVMCLFSCFNIGWFGIPVVLAVHGEEAARIMTALYIGGTIYGNSIGYVLASDTPARSRDVLLKIARVPAIYGFLAAAALVTWSPGTLAALSRSSALLAFFDVCALLTSLVGMGLVGMSMVGVNLREGLAAVGKLLALRLAVTAALVVVLLGSARSLGIGTPMEHQVIVMLPCLPIAANVLVFVARRDADAGFVGLVLFCSTVLSFVLLLTLFLAQKMPP